MLEDFRDLHLFESVIMTNCMRKINNELVANYREKTIEEQEKQDRSPFLFEISRRGSGEGEVIFPLSVSCCLTGDIVVADCINNRLQIYNGWGIWKNCVEAKKGDEPLFDRPHYLAMSANDDFPMIAAVADETNEVKFVDIHYCEIVSSFDIGYRATAVGWTCSGYLLATRPTLKEKDGRKFIVVDVFGKPDDKKRPNRMKPSMSVKIECPFPSLKSGACMPILQPYYGNKHCFLLGTRHVETVACYDLKKQKTVFRFQMTSPLNGMAVDMSDFASDPCMPNEIVACDQANRLLIKCQIPNEFTDRASTTLPTSIVARPRDGIGQARRCALSPWGHAIASEFGQDLETEEEVKKSRDKSTLSVHRLTVFRSRYCECHDWQPAKQHRMDPSVSRESSAKSTREVRRSGSFAREPPSLPWKRKAIEVDEQKFLDMTRVITPNPPDKTPEPPVLIDAMSENNTENNDTREPTMEMLPVHAEITEDTMVQNGHNLAILNHIEEIPSQPVEDERDEVLPSRESVRSRTVIVIDPPVRSSGGPITPAEEAARITIEVTTAEGGENVEHN